MNTYAALSALLITASLLTPAYANDRTSIETAIWSESQKHCIHAQFSDGEIANFGCFVHGVTDNTIVKTDVIEKGNSTTWTSLEERTINKGTQIIKGGFYRKNDIKNGQEHQNEFSLHEPSHFWLIQ